MVDRRSVAGDAVAPVQLTAPSGQTSPLTLKADGPGRATASVAAPGAGVWQVGDGTHLAFAVVGQDDPLEFADLRATGDTLRKAVHDSGGGVAFTASSTPQLRFVGTTGTAAGSGWIGLRRQGAHLVTGVSTEPLLPPWLALPLLLGLLFAAWRREATF